MGFRKTTSYKKKRYSRRYRRGGNNYASLASKLARKATYDVVKMFVNTERKFLDNNQWATATPITTAGAGGTFIYMNNVPNGNANNERIGNNLKLTSQHLKLSLLRNPGGSDSQKVRVLVLVDRQSNGIGFSLADYLDTPDIRSFNNLDNRYRYLTLFDRQFSLDINAKSNEIPLDLNFKKILKCSYSGPAAVIPETNSLIVCLMTDSTSAGPNVRGFTRIRYIDN